MSWRNYGATVAQTIQVYSQDREQAVILDCLKGLGRGRFLDIGAYHPTELSNTRALWELGWEGVMVEPAPGPMLTLLKEYGNDPRVTLIAGVVVASHRPTDKSSGTFTPGLLPLQVTDGPYSTADPENYAKWRGQGGFYGSFLVPTIPLGALLSVLGPFDFVDIDTEGGSADLFLRLCVSGTPLPHCVCVEYDDSPRLDKIETEAARSGYLRVFRNDVNVIYTRKA